DYAVTTGTLTFPPGDATPRTVDVAVFGDVIDEPTETFFVKLTLPPVNPNLTLGDDEGQGTINDNDPLSTVSVIGAQVPEGAEGTHLAYVAITANASGFPITVNYATANGTATQPSDYLQASGTVSFQPGTTIVNVPITVVGDATVEGN